jgi:hypothetical protein
MHYFGPYLAFFLSIPLSVLAVIPLVLLPETAALRKPDESDAENEQADSAAKAPILRMRLQVLKQHIQKDFVPLLKSLPILIGLISFVIGSFAVASGEIIMQYMKARFGWSYEKASLRVVVLDIYANHVDRLPT